MMQPKLNPSLRGYGYQWRISPSCCKAAEIAAGDIAPDCDSTLWFWLLAIGGLGAAFFFPTRRAA